MRGIHRWPVYSPHKWPVTRNLFPFDDIIMQLHFCDTNLIHWLSRWHNNEVEWYINFLGCACFTIVEQKKHTFGLHPKVWFRVLPLIIYLYWRGYFIDSLMPCCIGSLMPYCILPFPHSWPFVRRVHLSLLDLLTKGQLPHALRISLTLARISW